MPAYRGDASILSKYRGIDPIREQRRGTQLIWTAAPVFDGFDNDGWLAGWINEFLSEDLGALISDAWGQLRDGLNNFVGSVVAFVQGGVNQIGQLVAGTGTALVNAYCGAWGVAPSSGVAPPPPDGLLGLINGIPLIGPFLTTALLTVINGIATAVENIEHLIGTIPVIGNNLAQAIGLIPNQVSGVLGPPINFVIDQVGSVIGTLTCGAFTPTASEIAENIQYVIGVLGQKARMLIPDGLLSLDKVASRYRHPTLTSADDGFLEVRLADTGSPGLITQVFRRYSNSGFHNGVGMHFLDSTVSIVRRQGDSDALVLPGAAGAGPGDRFRLEQAGDTHTLLRNGHTVNAWTGTAAAGTDNRAVGMYMEGRKELLGQRLYSPSLDYLQAA